MTEHNYAAALVEVNKIAMACEPNNETMAAIRAIRHALRIADKLMQIPSTGMQVIGYENDGYDGALYPDNHLDIFKAMRDQMLKEIEGD